MKARSPKAGKRVKKAPQLSGADTRKLLAAIEEVERIIQPVKSVLVRHSTLLSKSGGGKPCGVDYALGKGGTPCGREYAMKVGGTPCDTEAAAQIAAYAVIYEQ